MAGKPRAATKKKDATQSPLADALKFVKLAQRESGETYQTHVVLSGFTAVTYDGVLAAGIRIEEDLTACPHTELLLKALLSAGGTVAVEQRSADKITVKTDRLTAHVPCVAREIMPNVSPDPAVAPINNDFIKGLEKIAMLATENGSHVVTSSILVRQYSMVATDRNIMFEYWHGIDLPTFALPKAAAIAIIKCGKELQWFGFSANTVTFYFADGCFIKSQLYDGVWPNVNAILDMRSNPWPVPQHFFEGVRAVAAHNEDGYVTFRKNELASGATVGIGASFTVNGVPAGPVFNSKYLLMLEGIAKTVDFVAAPGKAAFFGDNLRGVMMGVIGSQEPEHQQPPPQPPSNPQPGKLRDPNGDPVCDNNHKAVKLPGMYAGTYRAEPFWQWPNCTEDCIPF